MRDKYLLRKYGITDVQYQSLLREQGGRCAVCKQLAEVFKSRLAVDHCHSTGEVRGILCNYCNHRLVGRWRKANLDLLKAVVAYLDKEYTGWVVPPKIKKRRKHGTRKRLRTAQ